MAVAMSTRRAVASTCEKALADSCGQFELQRPKTNASFFSISISYSALSRAWLGKKIIIICKQRIERETFCSAPGWLRSPHLGRISQQSQSAVLQRVYSGSVSPHFGQAALLFTALVSRNSTNIRAACEQRPVSQRFLCLSRACLGKMIIVFECRVAQKAFCAPGSAPARSGACPCACRPPRAP
jgi:hypothetical protein